MRNAEGCYKIRKKSGIFSVMENGHPVTRVRYFIPLLYSMSHHITHINKLHILTNIAASLFFLTGNSMPRVKRRVRGLKSPYRRERKYWCKRRAHSSSSTSDSSHTSTSMKSQNTCGFMTQSDLKDLDSLENSFDSVLPVCTNLFVPLRASSPIRFDEDFHASERDLTSESDDDDSEEMLYKTANIAVSEFSERLSTISSKHTLSDAAVADVLGLFEDVLPLPNNIPSLYKLKKLDASPCSVISCGDGEMYMLPFRDQILSILERYPGIENMTSSPGSSDMYGDITSGKLFPQVNPDTFYFILNTDGFSPISSRKIQVWPLLLSVINLPPTERKRLCNIIMVGFYIGQSKPDWNTFLKHFITQLSEVHFCRGKHLTCKIVALVADSPARCSSCFIQNMNAR